MAAAIAADPNLVPDDLEFVEIHNPTGIDTDLTNWRIRGGIDIDFAAGIAIAGNETVVVVSFNPDNPANGNRVAAFRAHYGIGTDVRLIGGYGGELSNNDERVQLQRPDEPPVEFPLNIPRVIEDEVLYDATAPWPDTTDGSTIQRIGSSVYGSTAASWTAAAGTPGSVNFEGGARGDYDGNGVIDATDIDLLYSAINAGDNGAQYDLDDSFTVDSADAVFLVTNILGTNLGDANLDGAVNATDLNAVGLNWQGAGGWSDGDFDGDGVVDVRDLNNIGIHWQAGVAQAARPPRAPLSATSSDLAVVDAAIGEFEARRETATSMDSNDEVADRAAGSRSAGRIAHSWIRKSYRSLAVIEPVSTSRHGFTEIEAIDDVFADL